MSPSSVVRHYHDAPVNGKMKFLFYILDYRSHQRERLVLQKGGTLQAPGEDSLLGEEAIPTLQLSLATTTHLVLGRQPRLEHDSSL